MKKIYLTAFLAIVLLLSGLYLKKLILPYWFLPGNSRAEIGTTGSHYEIIAQNLEIPWDLVFLPSGEMLVTERPGRIIRFGDSREVIPVENIRMHGESGLLGMVLHPDFQKNRWIYLYYTTQEKGQTFNRVDRFEYENGKLNKPTLIIDHIPGAIYHDGGRMAFGPDGYLYITTGDAGKDDLAQDIHSLAGKILRLKDDGSIPEDNPFGNAVYSYGHRNPQGLTWDSSGKLWSTEHGNIGQDEINLIEKGGNYGWPVIRGDEHAPGMTNPILHSGTETWAPASALHWKGSLFFGGLRGSALFEAKLEDPIRLIAHFKNEFGRIRTVVLGPDGYFYILTSNRDGRGFPKPHDDKIIRIHPQIFD